MLAGNLGDVRNGLQIDGAKARKVLKDAKATQVAKDQAQKKLDDIKKAEEDNDKVQKELKVTATQKQKLVPRLQEAFQDAMRFFEKLGFEVVPKDSLPLKVWSDCVRCPKREGCDEIAMVRVLEDVPIVELPAATPTPRGVSIPVLEYAEED